MTDLHERFREWLLAGAPGEPARGAALHASACDRCLADVAALDALLVVDVAGAEMPFLTAGAPRPARTTGVRAQRALSGVTAVGLLVLAAMIGAGALRENTGGPGVAVDPTESPDGEGILAGGPSFTPAPSVDPGSRSPTAVAEESTGASQEPEASEIATGATPTQPPFVAPPPPAVTPGPTTAVTPQPTTTAATPVPTAASTEPTPTPTPTVAATPLPTAAPTPTPTPEPTPTPTPEPTLPPSEEPTP